MNYRGNQQYLRHMMAIRRDPDNAPALQSALNEKRFRRAQRARSQRPVWMTMPYLLNPAARVQPYPGRTQRIEDSVDILGVYGLMPEFMAGLEIDILHSSNNQSFFTANAESNSHSNFAYNFGGASMRYFGSPVPLERGQQLILNIYKNFTTSGVRPFVASFYGQRNLLKTDRSAQFDSETEVQIKSLIAQRSVPQDRFLHLDVTWSNDGVDATGTVTNLKTPAYSEPLLIRGLYAALGYSSISNLRIEGEEAMMLGETPIGAVARVGGEGVTDGDDKVFLFETPIFLPAEMQLVMDLRNSLFRTYYALRFDGVNTGITVLAETM
jgi:hypothetical protein